MLCPTASLISVRTLTSLRQLMVAQPRPGARTLITMGPFASHQWHLRHWKHNAYPKRVLTTGSLSEPRVMWTLMPIIVLNRTSTQSKSLVGHWKFWIVVYRH